MLQKAKSLGADAVERIEEPIEIIVGKVRRYDMMLKGGKRVECKAWSNFYESTIKKQFLEGDLCSVEKFEDIRYFVDESSMSLDTWFEHMSKFMTDNADEIWDEKKYEGVRNLFTNIANNQYGINIENVDDLKDFVVKNRDKWFDIVFKQEL
ncbi:MAG: hypothetical protein ACWA6U_18195 [Breznakibacter sp.]